ncbi:hypothetical protein BC831DRAFT_442524 [Entophlyctis helioformis]|nr:hypothetical protein BC831DRAFT_442524 [Entophlyctis helioformis]
MVFLVVACIVAVIILVTDSFLLVRVFKMPTSPYSIGLRTTTGIIIPSVFLTFATGSYPLFRENWIMTISIVLLYGFISVFALTQLEFLKILAPFFSRISTRAVSRVQIATAVMSVVLMAASFQRYLPEDKRTAVFTYAAIWIGLLALFDVSQHCVLLFYVLCRLRGATVAFKLGYAALVVVLFGLIFVCSISASQSFENAQLALVLRKALQNGQRKPAVSPPRPRAVKAASSSSALSSKAIMRASADDDVKGSGHLTVNVMTSGDLSATSEQPLVPCNTAMQAASRANFDRHLGGAAQHSG